MKVLILVLLSLFSLSGPAQEDDELLNELEADRRKQMEAAVKLNQAREGLAKEVESIPDQLKKLGFEKIDANALMNPEVVGLVQKMFKDSGLQKKPPKEVRDLILENVKNISLGRFLMNNPRVMDCIVDIVRDQNAMSSLVGMFLRKDDFKIYGGMWICLFILSWLFKKIVFGKDWSGGKRFLMSLMVNICVSCISLSLFYRMFEAELSPTAQIILKHVSKTKS